jgi:hypothetical protein
MDCGSRHDVRTRRKAVWGGEIGRPTGRLAAVLALVALSASCGDVVRQGTGSSYIILNALEAASGAEPTQFSGTLQSDVLTVVDDVPTTFNDVGRARMTLAMKDPGTADTPTIPTANNFITLNRYRVQYIRADGRNTPGVDVPYPFDGAITVTIAAGETSAGFEIVRHTAKAEAPLAALARNGIIIATLAEVTFFGRDQTGREVIVTGRITIDFGNFGDPS